MKQINDLKRHTASHQKELSEAMGRVLAGGWYVLGPEVAAFEKEFSDYCGASSCVGVANGTEALELALRALAIGQGRSIATVANAGGYAVHAMRAVGARPLFVEIDDASMNMSPAALDAALNNTGAGEAVGAVIFTHLYGSAAGIEAVSSICKRRGVPLIEDCAQAHGAVASGKKVGSWGAMGCFSFYPTKNLGGVGDGGAITTSDARLAERLRQLRQYGWGASKYISELSGARNSRLDEMQAAVLRLKLGYLDSWNARRRQIAARYNAALAGLPINLPVAAMPDNEAYVGHLYVIRCSKRDSLQKFLKARNIGCDVHYPLSDHLQPSWGGAHAAIKLPVSEKAAAEVLTLPCFPEMTDGEVDAVAAAVRDWTSQ